MKKIILLIFLLLISINIYSIDEETISLIFEKSDKGVIYIEQSLFFNSKDIDHENLFKKIEEEYDIEILDQHMALGSGTGFFITKEGHIITNYHVIDNSNVDKIKKAFLDIVRNKFLYNIPSYVLSYNEKDLIYSDFKKLIEKSKLSYRILVEGKDDYEAELLKSDEELDLAILKAKGSNFKALPLVSSETLKVGNSIIAIGYPLPSAMFNIVQDFKSTMTTGNVSSIRTDTWGIQHTAAINPGNSGGPLFNIKGEVIGINVGLMSNANDIYFSISSDKLINWLKDENLEVVLKQNSQDAKGIGYNYDVNENGFLETGTIIFVDLPEGYNIYIDGKWKGKTPTVLKSVIPGQHTLRIDSKDEFVDQKILVKADILNIFEYSPRLTKYKGRLFINTTPLKADVYIDGNKAGKSPYMKEINTGKHKIEIQMDSYIKFIDEVEIKKNILLEKEYKLQKGYKIKFSTKLPKDTTIELKRTNQTYEYSIDEKFWIENGDWEVTVKSMSFPKKTFNIKINNEDALIDFNPEYILAKIKFQNIEKESKILLDGEDITDKIQNNSYETSVGEHELEVISDKHETIKITINVEKDKENKIDLKYSLKEEYKVHRRERSVKSGRGVGIGLSIPGGLLTVGGIGLIAGGVFTYMTEVNNKSTRTTSLFDNSSDISSTDNNLYYIPLIAIGVVCCVTGFSLVTIGIVLLNVAGQRHNTVFNKLKEKNIDILLGVGYKNVNLCFSKQF